MPEGFESVYKSNSQSAALSMEALLKQHGIEAVLMSRRMRGLLSGLGSGQTQSAHELFVPSARFEEAMEILRGYHESRMLEPLSDEELERMALKAGSDEAEREE